MAIALLGGLLLAASCLAQDVGVVVLHGKWGNPHGWIAGLTSQLSQAGYAVEAPEMVWSSAQGYRGGLEEAQRQVDTAIAALRQRGVHKVVLIGHSLGGSFSVHYATRHPLDGLVVIVPAPYLDHAGFRSKVDSDYSRAKAMKAAGRGEETASFTDWNTNNTHKSLSMTPLVFIAFFDPQGEMNITHNAAQLPAALPVLWISATQEADGNRQGNVDAFAAVPGQAHAQFIEVESDHLHAPDAAIAPILAWLKQLD